MGCKWGICLLLGCALALGAGSLPQFSLADTAGRTHTPAEWSGKRAVVLLFLTTDCPLCNNYVQGVSGSSLGHDVPNAWPGTLSRLQPPPTWSHGASKNQGGEALVFAAKLRDLNGIQFI
jgi:hypothetical protein